MGTFAKGLVALAVGLIVTGISRAAVLTGSVDTPGNVNLTTQGQSDWIHWGRSVSSDVNRKSGGGSQISTFSLIGSGSNRARLSDSASTYSWTDGTPTASVANSRAGVYINNFNGPGRGFQITAPADLMERILDVYVGAYDASGTLEATLSDGSAAPFTNTLTGTAGQTVQGHYAIRYSANAPGQTLTVKWTETADHGTADNVTLQAAALSLAVVPEPATFSLIGGAGLLLLARRRK